MGAAGWSAAGEVRREKYFGRSTAGEVLRVKYGGRSTAGEIRRVKYGGDKRRGWMRGCRTDCLMGSGAARLGRTSLHSSTNLP
jgi:hypothetical protein